MRGSQVGYWRPDHLLNEALEQIKRILETTRQPTYAGDVPHQYKDKYLLAEFLTNAALNAQWTCLELLGLDDQGVKLLKDWTTLQTNRPAVSLRFIAEERCGFLREQERHVEAPSSETTIETTSSRSSNSVLHAIKSKFVTTIKEYVYGYRIRYRLSMYFGTDIGASTVLGEVERGCELITTVRDNPPALPVVIHDPLDVNITYVVQNLTMEEAEPFQFRIDRADEECHTPRRNRNITQALDYFGAFSRWAHQVHYYFQGLAREPRAVPGNAVDLSVLSADGTFIPVAPLFEKREGRDSVLLSPEDLGLFLQEQKRSLQEKFAAIDQAIPAGKLITAQEGKVMATLAHAMSLSRTYNGSIEAIEMMLHSQLIAAIGRTLQPRDFTQLVRSNNRKLFLPQYVPSPFCFAVQRPGHSPEGVISIEYDEDRSSSSSTLDNAGAMVDSFHSAFDNIDVPLMEIPLNAATKVQFAGKRHLHACLFHRFSDSPETNIALKARARQFSSFILLVGRITSATRFEPQAGLIVQNKDDLTIPLLLETIPTPKEFQDAIESLSPEQQKFAKAMRALQLESTLFGICVVEIKPELEKLLNLPPDALAKEIQLTQDLMTLFVEYQIPSDLLRYDGEADAAASAKTDAVRGYVGKIKDIIKGRGREDIENALGKAQYNQLNHLAESNKVEPAAAYGLFGGPPPPPAGSLFGTAPASSSFGGFSAATSIHQRGEQMSDLVGRSQELSAASMKFKKAKSAGPVFARKSAGMSEPVAAPPTVRYEGHQQQQQPVQSQSQSQSPYTSSTDLHDRPNPKRKTDDMEADNMNTSDTPDPRLDFTRFPTLLDSALSTLPSTALRPTTITLGPTWSRSRPTSILHSNPTPTSLPTSTQQTERNAAFDLLDALSRSGSIVMQDVVMHVVLAATHCFDQTMVEEVIRGNVDPVGVFGRSGVLVAATVNGVDGGRLVRGGEAEVRELE
ncbi:uncharacterized protein EV422DRAFT_523423 [Fimicolochytrium jonesii]|uniref:uncharacterized protein n=1 Tax=Fimicolochytrium jonesii TaxID=1396493 RepID=UPI0022FF2B55|nr:uncharacterized protein EV422DRAFT_523423 [Fimicolochytrium jonesii]KAI8823110.1 hypothetical protein EV422DRAFT_523423 [Fimicolochytrium jonesii]